MLRKQITHGHDYGHLVDGAGGYGEGVDGRRSTQHLMRIVRGPARFWSCQDDNSSFKLKSMMRKLMPQNQVRAGQQMMRKTVAACHPPGTDAGVRTSDPGAWSSQFAVQPEP
ncbi:GD23566 [Drosophila simulans]|uniref:GD23566 n=1 Tax=Drosophila simulans TaxID=7240 RepID=B4Q7A0_DROSI|nr:GD23566 [Drosophila simulans]